jgi:hypothetical protein
MENKPACSCNAELNCSRQLAKEKMMQEKEPHFPIVDRAEFDRHPKSQKPKDRERVLFSNASEDWVTWTAFRLLKSCTPNSWWPGLVSLAKSNNPSLSLPPDWNETPEIKLWETTTSPAAYESTSRKRMRSSGNPAWIARGANPKPVEGLSEIDVILQNATMLIFVEAKLGSDISQRTTYDPKRNQIVRNIDCLIDQAQERVPVFWMLVRDREQARLYTQLINHYRTEPNVLVQELPHSDASRVVSVAQNLSLILWKDLLYKVVQGSQSNDDEQTQSIKKELWRRVSGS